MEKKKAEILKQALDKIKNNPIFFVSDLVAYLPISNSTLYEYFPAGSDGMDAIKELIEINKVKVKSQLRTKLSLSDNPTALLAMYRLMSTPEEHRLLNQQYIENNITTEKPIFDIKPLEEEDNE